jgi:hypothetical protein
MSQVVALSEKVGLAFVSVVLCERVVRWKELSGLLVVLEM